MAEPLATEIFMSQSDYSEIYWNAQEMGVNALMLYLTVITGYLVVAYFVGSELTRSQSRFISILFVVFAIYSLWGVTQYWWAGEMARVVLEAGDLGKNISLNFIGVNPAVIAGPMGIAGIYGALRFMSDVRRPKSPK